MAKVKGIAGLKAAEERVVAALLAEATAAAEAEARRQKYLRLVNRLKALGL